MSNQLTRVEEACLIALSQTALVLVGDSFRPCQTMSTRAYERKQLDALVRKGLAHWRVLSNVAEITHRGAMQVSLLRRRSHLADNFRTLAQELSSHSGGQR